jgi:type III secretion protein N (ATPase)
VEGELADDPIAEETMSLIDGHIILSRAIAERGVYPPIDVSKSLSRLMNAIVPQHHKDAASTFRRLTSAYSDAEFMIRMGEYREGSDELVDRAVSLRERMAEFLRQSPDEVVSLDDSLRELEEICS